MTQFWKVVGADAGAKALLGIALIALIRFMPVEEYAALTFGAAVATMGAYVLAAGFNRIYILGFEPLRLGDRTAQFLGTQLVLLAVLAAVTVPLVRVLATAYPFVLALAAGVLLSEFAKTCYQRELAFGRYSAMEIGRALAQAIGIALLIAFFGRALGAEPVLALQGATLIGIFAATLGTRLRCNRLVQFTGTTVLLREILSGPYAAVLVYFSVIAVYAQADIIMLKLLAGELQLATYGSASRYYGLLMLVVSAAHAVLLPAMQRVRTGAALDELYREHLRRLAVFTPAVLLAAWAAAWVLPWVDQGRYPDAVGAFRILCLSALVSFSCSPQFNLLMKFNRFRALLVLAVVALPVMIALHLVLIPRAGAIGAAWATLAGSICVTVPMFFLARRLRRELP